LKLQKELVDRARTSSQIRGKRLWDFFRVLPSWMYPECTRRLLHV